MSGTWAANDGGADRALLRIRTFSLKLASGAGGCAKIRQFDGGVPRRWAQSLRRPRRRSDGTARDDAEGRRQTSRVHSRRRRKKDPREGTSEGSFSSRTTSPFKFLIDPVAFATFSRRRFSTFDRRPPPPTTQAPPPSVLPSSGRRRARRLLVVMGGGSRVERARASHFPN